MDASAFEEIVDGPVVVGADGSPQATPAIEWAAEEAAARGRPLQIVHGTGVRTWAGRLPADAEPQVLATARALVDDAAWLASDRAPGVTANALVSREVAVTALLEAAGATGTIVVGSRGLGGFSALLLGSVGRGVAGQARTPVVVVRGGRRAATGVVVAGVRDQNDTAAVRFAAVTAERRKSSLRLISVWATLQYVGSTAPVIDDVRAVTEAGERVNDRAVGQVREEFPGLTVTGGELRAPSPAGALVEASSQADLLVLGARRADHEAGPRLGRVAHAALHHAHCPVVIVPHR